MPRIVLGMFAERAQLELGDRRGASIRLPGFTTTLRASAESQSAATLSTLSELLLDSKPFEVDCTS